MEHWARRVLLVVIKALASTALAAYLFAADAHAEPVTAAYGGRRWGQHGWGTNATNTRGGGTFRYWVVDIRKPMKVSNTAAAVFWATLRLV